MNQSKSEQSEDDHLEKEIPDNNKAVATKQYKGIGLIFGALSGICYAAFALLVRLQKNESSAEMIAWARSIEAFVILLPVIIVKKGENIFGRSLKELAILLMVAIKSSIIIVLISTSFQMIRLADVFTLLALIPMFVAIINCILFYQTCGWSNTLIIITCTVGAVLCIQPPFIFGNQIRHDWIFYKGFMLSTFASILWAALFIAIGYLKDLNTYVKVFWGNAGQFFPLTCYLLATNSLKFPIFLKSYLYLFTAGFLAFLGLVNIVIGTYFDSPLMVAIGRTADIPLSFVFDTIIFAENVEILSIIGAVLIVLSIIVPATVQLYRNRS